MDLTVSLPTPHPTQAAIMEHPAKRKVICAGRRFGKTHMAALEGVKRALGGRRVVFASTTQDQVDTFWELAKGWLHPLLDAKLIYKNESKRLMVFNWNGGRIKAKTAWNADTMRGDYGDFIVLDEFAQMTAGVWDYVVSPMMVDTDGDTWFISTPVMRNHFFNFYQKSIQDQAGRWAAFHATTHDNPHLSEAGLAELVGDMSETAYRQEIMAEFLEGQGSVFRNIYACINAPHDVRPSDVAQHKLIAAVDWGKHHDYTVVSVFDVVTCEEVTFDRFNQIDYAVQRDRILALCERWGVSEVWVELNSVGEPNFEALTRDAPEGLRVLPFETTSKTKPQLIESLALAFEREEAQWLDVPVATGEFESYERTVSPTTGRSRYSAPDGLHDDCVMARAIAWWGVQHAPQPYVQTGEIMGLYASQRGSPQRRNGYRPGANGHSIYGRGRRAKDTPGA